MFLLYVCSCSGQVINGVHPAAAFPGDWLQFRSDRKLTGRSRGFGFVEMDNAQGIADAIAGLHEKPIGGRNLTVNEARERSSAPGPRGPGAGGAARGPGGGAGARPDRPFSPRPSGPAPAGGGRGAPREWERPPDKGSGRPKQHERGRERDWERDWKRGDESPGSGKRGPKGGVEDP